MELRDTADNTRRLCCSSVGLMATGAAIADDGCSTLNAERPLSLTLKRLLLLRWMLLAKYMADIDDEAKVLFAAAVTGDVTTTACSKTIHCTSKRRKACFLPYTYL